MGKRYMLVSEPANPEFMSEHGLSIGDIIEIVDGTRSFVRMNGIEFNITPGESWWKEIPDESDLCETDQSIRSDRT